MCSAGLDEAILGLSSADNPEDDRERITSLLQHGAHGILGDVEAKAQDGANFEKEASASTHHSSCSQPEHHVRAQACRHAQAGAACSTACQLAAQHVLQSRPPWETAVEMLAWHASSERHPQPPCMLRQPNSGMQDITSILAGRTEKRQLGSRAGNTFSTATFAAEEVHVRLHSVCGDGLVCPAFCCSTSRGS